MAHDGEVIIGLLGPVSVIAAPHPDSDSDAPQATPVPGLRAKRLLTSLALADGRTRSAERLIDDVWGDDAPRSPSSALHTQISRLRQLLGAAHLQGSGSGYRLVGCRTDLDVVTEMIASTDDAECAAIWWRGTPGDDLGTDEPGGLIDELTARARQVADRLDRSRYAAAMAAGDHVTARSIAEKRCLADPLDESAHLDLMQALAAAGRVADAIAVYTGLRRRLSAELGVDPGAQISALHTQLLSGTDTSVAEPTEVPRTVRRGRGIGLLADTTALIGRDADVDAIVSAIETGRVVTIQGPGGVGKTRVANRVGHRLVETGASVFYVPLAPIRADDDVVPAIAAALGVGESDLSGNRPRMSVGDLHDRLLDAVRGRDAVLVLDNCEQVIDRCAQIVADLLAADDHIRVLVTSRSPLHAALGAHPPATDPRRARGRTGSATVRHPCPRGEARRVVAAGPSGGIVSPPRRSAAGDRTGRRPNPHDDRRGDRRSPRRTVRTVARCRPQRARSAPHPLCGHRLELGTARRGRANRVVPVVPIPRGIHHRRGRNGVGLPRIPTRRHARRTGQPVLARGHRERWTRAVPNVGDGARVRGGQTRRHPGGVRGGRPPDVAVGA
uniref:AfsR/SARP family transcriptional regulator n=1 Tax=Gordonia polyisoprenivorans TaxID=84595 RepID=UPI001FCC6F00|nr:BTAD domain-containing putative transcriptional regulator [Gordonia polyisoprenivorans]